MNHLGDISEYAAATYPQFSWLAANQADADVLLIRATKGNAHEQRGIPKYALVVLPRSDIASYLKAEVDGVATRLTDTLEDYPQ